MASGLSVCDFAVSVLLLRAKTLFAEAIWGPMAVSESHSRQLKQRRLLCCRRSRRVLGVLDQTPPAFQERLGYRSPLLTIEFKFQTVVPGPKFFWKIGEIS